MSSNLIEAWILNWGDAVDDYAASVEKMCGVRCRSLKMIDHETVVWNTALRMCDAPYCWLLSDDTILYPETAIVMAEWMERHPRIAVMCPNREAEPPGTPYPTPYRKYLADNTAIMVRKDAGVLFDEEFKFTGWSDLDYGLEVEWRGYEVHVETRVSVLKAPTPYGSWSSYRRAVNAASRLLLEAKWYWVGRKNWRSHGYYNRAQAKPCKRIPTIYELCCFSNEELDAFCDSVRQEHPQIQMTIDGTAGNEGWTWPITK